MAQLILNPGFFLSLQISSRALKQYRFDEIRPLVARISSGLVRAGLRHGDVVLLCVTGCIEVTPIALAVIAAGGILTACNPTFTTSKSDKNAIFESDVQIKRKCRPMD